VKRELILLLLINGLLTAACGSQVRADKSSRSVTVWRAVGTWSGQGNRQTESFTSETGALRVRWSTRTARAGDEATFKVTAHSAISGRLLEQVVDARGAGSGVGYVNQDPHVFYLMVEAESLDWTVAVEEGVTATVAQ
jgi:hypothetical protein